MDYPQNHKQSLKIIEHVPAFRRVYFTRSIRGLDEMKPCSTDQSLPEYIVKAVAYVWTVAYAWISYSFASEQYLNLILDVE